ncbi:type II secretion system F family protein [Ferrimonas aestuarii]|uniref:Type II secretion system F family protein n=1 Tax=Ferrimonas aestuarii TaxID=2569539 RepID=A0A4U1BVI2_9GAMM|nr:type II secretion system F family protein [Ferrimonas aestuarii]TKB58474.1 type II secretion system F family protein [Ferrimonas aestuarii]
MTYLAIATLLGVLLALITTKLVRQQAKHSHVRHYLHSQQPSKLSWLQRTIGNLSSNQESDVQKKLLEAGIYQGGLAKYFMPAKYAMLLLSLLLLAIVDLEMQQKLMLGPTLLIFFIVVPDLILESRKRWLIKKTARQLPYMLDMMAVCVQTGMTIEASFRYLGEELESFDKDLCYQIRRTSDAASLQGLEKALHDLSLRLPTPEVRSFCFTLIQNLQYGTSIAQVLSDLSEDMRRMQILSMEEKIGKLSAKMSVPLILLIMFPIVVLILAPGIVQLSLELTQ